MGLKALSHGAGLLQQILELRHWEGIFCLRKTIDPVFYYEMDSEAAIQASWVVAVSPSLWGEHVCEGVTKCPWTERIPKPDSCSISKCVKNGGNFQHPPNTLLTSSAARPPGWTSTAAGLLHLRVSRAKRLFSADFASWQL